MESMKIFQTIMTQFCTIVQYELCLEKDCSHPFQVDQVHDASIFCFLLVGGVGILDLCVKLAHLGKQALINDGTWEQAVTKSSATGKIMTLYSCCEIFVKYQNACPRKWKKYFDTFVFTRRAAAWSCCVFCLCSW